MLGPVCKDQYPGQWESDCMRQGQPESTTPFRGRLIPLPVLQLHYKATVEKARNIAFFTPAQTESLV